MFVDVLEQERDWCKYLFKFGSMIGLNEEILCDYLNFITAKRMKYVGLKPTFKYPAKNPLGWSDKWIAGSDVQVAPQETELTSYKGGSVEKDIKEGSFKNYKL